jgi:hypothetical protein
MRFSTSNWRGVWSVAAPASLTPSNRLKFEFLSLRQFSGDPQLTSVYRTTSCTVTLWLARLLVPLILNEKVPVVVEELVVMVSVDVPPPFTEVGLKVAVEFVGSPLILNDTVPVKPLIGVTVTVYVALLPRVTVSDEGEAETENEFTTRVTVVEWVRLGLVLVPVIVSV